MRISRPLRSAVTTQSTPLELVGLLARADALPATTAPIRQRVGRPAPSGTNTGLRAWRRTDYLSIRGTGRHCRTFQRWGQWPGTLLSAAVCYTNLFVALHET